MNNEPEKLLNNENPEEFNESLQAKSERVHIKGMYGFLSIILMQTRQKSAGRLTPVKDF